MYFLRPETLCCRGKKRPRGLDASQAPVSTFPYYGDRLNHRRAWVRRTVSNGCVLPDNLVFIVSFVSSIYSHLFIDNILIIQYFII